MFRRITKQQARKLWAKGETIYLCPSNMRVGTPWAIEMPVSLTQDMIDNALRYKSYYDNQDNSSYDKQYSCLWEGSVEKTTWQRMYDNWRYYNTNHEMGYYVHYYIQVLLYLHRLPIIAGLTL